MAVLIETVDSDDETSPRSLDDLLGTLAIPIEYGRLEILDDRDDATLDKLAQWKTQALATLQDLRTLLKKTRFEMNQEDRARAIYAVVPFRAEEDWSDEDMAKAASDSLSHIDDNVDTQLLEILLERQIKPVFAASPHPSVHAHTGRRLARDAGGPMAVHDMYEGQVWKTNPGVGEVLAWCVERIRADAYERVWYLVVPPMMTLLDDYEGRYKLTGIRVARTIIANAPTDLLRRTGITDLLFDSFKQAFTFLHNPFTPALLRAVAPTAIELIQQTTTEGSEKRFSQLCGLLGDGVIGSVWIYAGQDVETIEASIDVLPMFVKALGVGAVRYLKALIPQLTHPLQGNPGTPSSRSIQRASIAALRCVMQTCSVRMYRWKGTVLEAVAKCWVDAVDSGKTDEDTKGLKCDLREVCVELARVAPGVCEDYDRLLALDKTMFEDLVWNIPNTTDPPAS